jgi:thiamine-monophosphate kinase
MGERERVAMLRRVLGDAGGAVPLGIGDDAAVLDVGGRAVVSVDVVIEHVHFRRAWLSFEDLGFKATMAALSDLAAMGARPIGVVAALGLPPDVDDAALEAMARGQRAACDRAGTSVVGGNLARAGELSIATTVIGVPVAASGQVLRRDGARPGDRLVIAGSLGLARAGLLALSAEQDDARLAGAIAAWRRPVAELEMGAALAEEASAAIDLSDGLAIDLHRLAGASGLCVVIDGAALVEAPLRAAAEALGADPLALALAGGEEYALVAAVRADLEVAGTRVIGRCEAGAPDVVIERDGARSVVPPDGFDHFAPSR